MKLIAIVQKELIDSLRDRRSLFSALLFSLLGPLLIGLAFGALASNENRDEPLSLSVQGSEHAIHLIAFLEQNGALIREAPENPEGAVRQGQVDVTLIVPSEYGREYRENQRATVKLVSDPSRSGSRRSAERARELVAGYSRQVSTMRLLARGISPDISRPVVIEEVDVSTERSRAATLLGMLPVFLLVSAFIAGMNVAIDSTAGERERGSLEPLLLNPVSRSDLMMGKWIATVCFNSLGVLLTLTFSVLVLKQIPLEKLGIWLNLGVPEIAAILIVALPLAFLASGLQLWIATSARNFREGQSYLSLLLFVPMIPGMLLEFYPMQAESWMWAVPILGQHQLLSTVMRGEAVPWLGFAAAGGAALSLGLISTYGAARMLQSERIIFGR